MKFAHLLQSALFSALVALPASAMAQSAISDDIDSLVHDLSLQESVVLFDDSALTKGLFIDAGHNRNEEEEEEGSGSSRGAVGGSRGSGGSAAHYTGSGGRHAASHQSSASHRPAASGSASRGAHDSTRPSTVGSSNSRPSGNRAGYANDSTRPTNNSRPSNVRGRNDRGYYPPPPHHHRETVVYVEDNSYYNNQPDVYYVEDDGINVLGLGVRVDGLIGSSEGVDTSGFDVGVYLHVRPTRWFSIEVAADIAGLNSDGGHLNSESFFNIDAGARFHAFDYAPYDVYASVTAGYSYFENGLNGGNLQVGIGASYAFGGFEIGLEAKYLFMANPNDTYHSVMLGGFTGYAF